MPSNRRRTTKALEVLTKQTIGPAKPIDALQANSAYTDVEKGVERALGRLGLIHAYSKGVLKVQKQRQLKEALNQNDKAFYRRITADRKSGRYGPKVDREKLPRCSFASALIVVRGRALSVTREELAAHCGIAPKTAWIQESTDWQFAKHRPCWKYWAEALRWGLQCWGHMPDYHKELKLISKFVALEAKSGTVKEFVAARDKLLSEIGYR